jgi:hypothetical protein
VPASLKRLRVAAASSAHEDGELRRAVPLSPVRIGKRSPFADRIQMPWDPAILGRTPSSNGG